LGAAQVIDMESSDLQVQVIGKMGTEEVDALLYDPMMGGSGLLEQMIKNWPRIIDAAIALSDGCASACDSSCIDCLQHFRNSFYHDKLDRHTALEYFREWGKEI